VPEITEDVNALKKFDWEAEERTFLYVSAGKFVGNLW
jgi:hypothetical protein